MWAIVTSAGWDGGGVWFTASTDYSAHSDTNKDEYRKYQVEAKFKDVEFDMGNSQLSKTWDNLDSTYFDNETDLEQTHKATFSKTIKDTFTTSVTKSVKVGVEVSGGFKLDKIAEFGVKFSTEMCYSKTETKTHEESRTWTRETDIRVPPHSVVTAVMQLNESSLHISWKADVELNGHVAVWFNNAIDFNTKGGSDRHHLWFVPIQNVLKDIEDWAKSGIVAGIPRDYADGYQSLSSSVLAKAEGVLTGKYGTDARITLKQGKKSLSEVSDALPASPENSPVVYKDRAIHG
ncbi:ETX/MTX2 family pore-forming toxin [Streptomyces celluloflavus]|uniref:ETX/MTX2 family pore-forming toxin n=1 Tax=Streptomyces celluloflavus TaxID=58344 RepID=UPI0036A82B99